jgi:hypothetical protein
MTVTLSLEINLCSLAASSFSCTCSAADFGSLPFRMTIPWPQKERTQEIGERRTLKKPKTVGNWLTKSGKIQREWKS